MTEYHIINLNDTMIKCFRDGRIFTLSKRCKKYEKWIIKSQEKLKN